METREDAQRKGARCDVCPLARNGKFVPTAFPASGRADVGFIGEAPGANEARDGVPFVGASGRLLDRVLKHHGINREEVVLTNACLCRPPDNDTPTPEAVAACKPRLLRELSDVQVRTVVPMGNVAAQSVLGLASAGGITKLRVGMGRTSPYEELAGVRVVPTIHPAACLRQGDFFPFLVNDIGKVVGEVEPWHEPRWIVVDDRVEALQVVAELRAREGPLAVDIESDIEKDVSFEHSSRHGLLCIGVAYARDKAVVFGENICQDGELLHALGDLFRDRRIIGQNFKFDAKGLYGRMGAVPVWFDTLIADYVLDERPGIHGLKQQLVEKLGWPQYDDELKKYVGTGRGVGYGVIPRPVLYKYNAFDAAGTYALYELQVERLRKANLLELHDFLVEASNELMFVELNGIAVDLAYNDHLLQTYQEDLGPIEERLNEIVNKATQGVIPQINPRSPVQVKKVLAAMKYLVDSTNEATLNFIMEHADIDTDIYQFCETLLRHREGAKSYGTYVKGIRKRVYRGRVYPTFLLHGTTTGRLSCRNPNLQNVTRGSVLRQQFIPAKPDNVFVQVDYSQAELRVLSYLAGDTYFRDIFRDGERDLFNELTPVLYPYARKEDMAEHDWKELRIRVKAFVYGLSYGRGAFTIAQEFKIPESEALALQRKFFAVIPEIVEFRKQVVNTVLAGKDLVSPFGRHRRFWLITEENKKKTINEALAFLPQSTASDICLRAMVWARRELRGTGCFIRNIVHDSILADGPYDMREDMMGVLSRNMIKSAEEVVGDYVPFAVDIKVGQNWGEV